MKAALLIIFIPFFLLSCLRPAYFSIIVQDQTNPVKTSFSNGKLVQSFSCMPYHNGSVVIRNDFTFSTEIVLNIKNTEVEYKGRISNLHFIGSNIDKDTIHIDGDENIITLFEMPPAYMYGDTIKVRFDNFLHDIEGREHKIAPLLLVMKKSKASK